jgi:2-oxoglutarate ferredoxin oxidoreductase subunit alpha
MSSRDHIDILIAFDLETIERHHQDLTERGVVIYDAATCRQEFSDPEFLNIPVADIIGEMQVHKIMANSVIMGAVLGLMGLDLKPFNEIIGDFIHKKTAEIVKTNINAAMTGLDYVTAKFVDRISWQMPAQQKQRQLLINGNQAIGLGALVSGCKFYAAYPMTPATGIMNYLATKARKHRIVIEQAEDEIGAINMALGASYAGVRAMTATSGGGFALMTEGLSLAGITETPVVIAEVQRPGPATGLPTRTEQSDLSFVLYGGHGEFPRVVFTPGTPEQAFYPTNKAFHLAEKFQIPVLIQSDQYLADSEWTFSDFDTEQLFSEDFRLRGEKLKKTATYQRYAYAENGISPLAIPGQSRHLVVVDSDEHDEDGHIVEDGATRKKMVAKRLLQKIPLIRKEIASPTFYGDQKPKNLLVCYGSCFGVVKEAVENLSKDHSIAMLHFSEVYPFPLSDEFDFIKLLAKADRTICIENNATSQFARLLRAETGFNCQATINKYDGRPFTLDSLTGELHDHLY